MKKEVIEQVNSFLSFGHPDLKNAQDNGKYHGRYHPWVEYAQKPLIHTSTSLTPI